MTRVLVIGASGMLGHKLCQQLPEHGFEVAATVRRPSDFAGRFGGVFGRVQVAAGVDVLDDRRLLRAIDEVMPQVVINCAGIVKQLPEASDPLVSVGVNAYLPHRLAQLCATRNCRLIHISTDCVFAGTRGKYTELDPPDAEDLYGRSKALGETTNQETAALTLRTSIVGRELETPGHGLVEWFLAQNGNPVRGYARTVFSGLTTNELAGVIARIIADHPQLRGLYHVAAEPIDKCELLNLLRGAYGLSTNIARDESNVCDRSLTMDRFREATGYTAPPWPEMVEQMARDATPYVEFHRNGRN